MHWLIEPAVLQELRAAVRAGRLPSAEEERQYLAQHEGAAEPLILARNGAEAIISITGVLSERRRYLYELFGGGSTSYAEIRAALAIADGDPTVKRITLLISSPGGNVDGMFETFQALEQTQKPVTVRANRALSAAYGMAAVTGGRIVAVGKHAEFGSVGVAARFVVWDDEVSITNTDSPDKRPDVRTEEGKAVVQRELDGIAKLYMEAIASGRSRFGKTTSLNDVRNDFGRGAVLLASEARAAGMIDSIETHAPRRGGKTSEETTMNKLLAKTLGLPEEATEAQILSAVGDLQRAGATAKADREVVTALEAATGKPAQEALGVIRAWKSDKEEAEGKVKTLEGKLAEQTTAAETEERARLMKLAGPEGKKIITSDKEREFWSAQPLETLKGYVESASAKVPTKEHHEPGATPSADPKASGTRHNGKTYAEMTGPERAALHDSDPELFDRMSAEYRASL